MEKMKIDKTTIGLSIVLAAVVALAVFSASLPAMADTAEQNATVSKATNMEILNQTGVTTVTYWNFTATIGSNCSDPANSDGETQGPTDNSTPIARIKNPSGNPTLTIWLNAAIFSPDRVSNEWYNITAITDNSTDAPGINNALPLGDDTDTSVDITADNLMNLYLKIKPSQSGTATSTFSVLGEGL